MGNLVGYAHLITAMGLPTDATATGSGQLIPDTVLRFSSVFAGANPSLN